MDWKVMKSVLLALFLVEVLRGLIGMAAAFAVKAVLHAPSVEGTSPSGFRLKIEPEYPPSPPKPNQL